MTASAAHPQDLRAAELALGVLEGQAFDEARALARADQGFAEAVEAWELRLAGLAEGIAPVAPSERVWTAIRSRLAQAPANDNAWNNVGLWRGVTAASVAVAVVSLGVMLWPRPAPVAPTTPPAIAAAAPYVALVSAPDGGPSLAAITVEADLRRIVVTPVALTEEQARSLELWVVPADGSAPRSLGLVRAGTPTVLKDIVLPVEARGAALAISREPEGGSPTGAPTGPILGVGALTSS
ncbi:MAG: anti-sigma factor [Caulobacter sp.]|nr:anti-sigma factor [Caulobacter sp.]